MLGGRSARLSIVNSVQSMTLYSIAIIDKNIVGASPLTYLCIYQSRHCAVDDSSWPPIQTDSMVMPQSTMKNVGCKYAQVVYFFFRCKSDHTPVVVETMWIISVSLSKSIKRRWPLRILNSFIDEDTCEVVSWGLEKKVLIIDPSFIGQENFRSIRRVYLLPGRRTDVRTKCWWNSPLYPLLSRW